MRPALLLVAAAALALVELPTVHAGQASEQDVKAAFVLNFLKFVEWPPGRVPAQGAAFIVVTIGQDAFSATLARACASQRVLDRSVVIRAAQPGSDLSEAHLLFITTGERQRLPAILRAVEGKPVVTVGDTPGFGQSGVMLNLLVQDEHVRFEANTSAAARAGLRLSSHLLRIARIVG